jgi:hypothetical protein
VNVSLKAILGGALDGGASETGRPDLLRRVVDGILKLASHGDRGLVVMPPEVDVRINVAEGSLQVIERFVNDPAFDREVEAEVLNRLVRAREDQMPRRRYVVASSDKPSVVVTEAPPRTYSLRMQGGDRDGQAVPLPGARRDLLLGRGPWHGDDQHVANDVVLCDSERGVSRRAARLRRVGAAFEVESLDQREALSVLRPDGQRLRPSLSASGKVPLRPGDVLEFTDGKTTVLTAVLEEA